MDIEIKVYKGDFLWIGRMSEAQMKLLCQIANEFNQGYEYEIEYEEAKS